MEKTDAAIHRVPGRVPDGSEDIWGEDTEGVKSIQ